MARFVNFKGTLVTEKLKQIIMDNKKYLVPSLRLEIESQIIEIQSKKIEE
jgi:hypothetical protein